MSWTDYRDPLAVSLTAILDNCEWSRSRIAGRLRSAGCCDKHLDLFVSRLIAYVPAPSNAYDIERGLTYFCKSIARISFYEEGEESSEALRLHAALEQFRADLSKIPAETPTMMASGAHRSLASVSDLCSFLSLTQGELEFLSDFDLWERRRREPKLQNYHYVFKSKRQGRRLLEIPKELLKECQRRIHTEILSKLPVHPAACGYTAKGAVGFAELHCNRPILLKLDLDNFFVHVRRAHVQHCFRLAGYPYFVSKFLTGLCVNCPPVSIARQAGEVYNSAHLPQGAPTSPALSNLCFYEIDRRLALAAEKAGLTYTRYADDLAFSGDLNVRPTSFTHTVDRIVREAGHRLNHTKTRVVTQNRRQHLCGITVNSHINCSRAYYDELKAILHNCVTHGPTSQNRENHPSFRHHLLGRINYLKQLNPSRGKKLLTRFQDIKWR